MVAERLPRLILRAEGLAILVAAVTFYATEDYGFLPFFFLALAPDVSFLGYAAGPRVGAVAYNAAHSTIGPAALAVAGVLADADVALQVALVWFAHIGADRLLGYGLKYPTGFKDTHIQRV